MPEQILLMSGVVSGINWAARTFGTQDAGILIQTPVYPPFHRVAGNAGLNMGKNPLLKTSSGYEIDFDDFEKKISQGVGMFVLCNPHNPVGRVFTREELEKMGEICLRNQVVICSDEIHCDLLYSGQHHIPISSLSEELAQNTVTLMAASKTFNIPGLHFSFAIVPNKAMRKKMERVGAGMVGHPSFLANEAAKAAFSKCDDWLVALRDYLESNRDFVMQFIKENLPAIKLFQPQGTYLAWLDCNQLDLQPDPHHFFLEKAKVALNDGVTFGENGSGYVRLNFGCPRATLEMALKQMADAVDQKLETG
jgi:cystathionine beta-lyase